jgi:hypothetical protein
VASAPLLGHRPTRQTSPITIKQNQTRSLINRDFYQRQTSQNQTKQKIMTTKSTNIKHLFKLEQGGVWSWAQLRARTGARASARFSVTDKGRLVVF